ncbi:phenylalanine--tRNA ligase subunit alpha [Patescibacteria group bacterium]|nr:phenylalanine--tRNA ligase subunit alpha [Patescibacteria group bacterium]MBU2159236.1 phenylalanine--tRNA ligase subunit alpha [Patescibacteria group bacterium]MBU2220457.1 phenylalanine--tRNA ligase subunit alpha [Patescibacteria group bacterium]
MPPGRLHPISVAIRDIASIFGRMGFSVAYGPELEEEHYNFNVLNIPADHPARDMQDTFWTKEDPRRVPRTQTSPVQVRYIEQKIAEGTEPPYRIIVPGKVFRNEATDATHEAQFYQNEGLVVGKGITLAHLKGTLEQFFKEYLSEGAQVRFRPSFFPFTEPSVEVDVWFEAPGKEGRWLEVMGAGMVHPSVLENAGLDPKEYQGFAFGGGIERLIMVKYGVDDIRGFHGGDIRFVYGFDETTA